MELQHICGNTYAVWGEGAVLGLYRLNERDVILLDTGVKKTDREPLDDLILRHGFAVKGIFCSHAHYDHSGNTSYLRARWDAQVAAQIIEAGIAAIPEGFHANYPYTTYAQCRAWFREECFLTDVVIGASDDHVHFCGVDFGIVQLPGHAAGQIGIITPDNVAYLADCLLGHGALASSKLPTSMCIEDDLRSKERVKSLGCRAYILAHRDVILGDIAPLADANVQFYQRKINEVLDCLHDGMSADQWRSALSESLGFRTQNEFKLGVIRRNFGSFLIYLEDSHRIHVAWDHCTKRYFHTT